MGDHHVLIGDEYVFGDPHKLGLDLNSWYVNGRMGAVAGRGGKTFIDFHDYAHVRRKALKGKS